MTDPVLLAPPGWHPDPTDPDALRYWDGERWTRATAVRPSPVPNPPAPQSAEEPPSNRRRSIPILGVASVVAAVAVLCTLAVAYRGTPGAEHSETEGEYLVGVQNLISAAQSQADIEATLTIRDEELLEVGSSFCSGMDNGQDSITATRQALASQSTAAAEALVLAVPSSAVLHLCPEHEDDYFDDLADLQITG